MDFHLERLLILSEYSWSPRTNSWYVGSRSLAVFACSGISSELYGMPFLILTGSIQKRIFVGGSFDGLLRPHEHHFSLNSVFWQRQLAGSAFSSDLVGLLPIMLDYDRLCLCVEMKFSILMIIFGSFAGQTELTPTNANSRLLSTVRLHAIFIPLLQLVLTLPFPAEREKTEKICFRKPSNQVTTKQKKTVKVEWTTICRSKLSTNDYIQIEQNRIGVAFVSRFNLKPKNTDCFYKGLIQQNETCETVDDFLNIVCVWERTKREIYVPNFINESAK